MGFDQVGSVAVKGGSWFLLPTLWISVFFLVCMIGFYGFQSIQQHSTEPLIKGVLFGIVGSDHKLSYLIDDFKFEHPYVSMFKSFSGFWNCIFEKVSFFFLALEYLWFIYVFCVLIYYMIDFMGGDMMPMFNKIFFVILVFAVLQFSVGLLMYNYENSDKVCSGTSSQCMMSAVSHSIPFEGTFKLFKTIFTKELFIIKNNQTLRIKL